MTDQKYTVAVLGCGLIGQSWAALFTAYGYDVIGWDPEPKPLSVLQGQIARSRDQVRVPETARLKKGCFRLVDTPEAAVASAFWVQENAPELVPVKVDLYRRVEAAASVNTVIASSTSSLTWSELAPGLKYNRRFITAHPFNPPHIMPLVEIYAADEDARRTAVSFFRDLGREPVVLSRDVVGHIANRLASALWREAVNIVAENVADVAAVDAALVHGPGLRWSVVGAHMAYHLGGGPGGIEHYLKHLGPSQERRWSTLGTPRLTPDICERLVQGVMAEARGRSVAELEAERDRCLLRALSAREECRDQDEPD
ncbi:3-hydroxyacyl-CoA dehydrogenase NAD-binding domain-containing protein [Bradyrhizobium yuanmingense]|uniref:3-hydroxyacyl-CoA dehydrogenase NAD-binding domain-containing protein n=1 Tax=Bradyrhizobium yuanmingense TaxID=108015 RepID=UPI0023B9DEDF|nr:3-hydroxyacyl-CoA dehydrogenase NAD-binding domain-containing protein [Bradyrhizobium yuanmingense]MDF0498879.1 3-hydroxyacyl-CoA dehydrogenase NAD-binding domain-containing protein [Bradyrhizobium yuanmingense]